MCYCCRHKILSSLFYQCSNSGCRHRVHVQCMQWRETELGRFECTECIILNNDPLKVVEKQLIEPSFIASNLKFQFKIPCLLADHINNHLDDEIEIRCIKLDGIHFFEQTWPDKCEVYINDSLIKEFRPLNPNSSLKKRRDEKLVLGKERRIGTNSLRFVYENVADGKNTRAGADPKYVFTVLHIRRLSVKELSDSIVKCGTLPLAKCEKQIQDKFCENKDLRISEVKVDLICKMTFTHLSIPARGLYCNHLSCFSLNSFLQTMESNIEKKWRCPLCRKPCYKIVVDPKLEELVQKAVRLPGQPNQVIIKKSGEMSFTHSQLDLGQTDSVRSFKKSSITKESPFEVLSLDEDIATEMEPNPVREACAVLAKQNSFVRLEEFNPAHGAPQARPKPLESSNFLEDKDFIGKLFNYVSRKNKAQSADPHFGLGNKKSSLAIFEENLRDRLNNNYLQRKCFQLFYDMLMEKKQETDLITAKASLKHKPSIFHSGAKQERAGLKNVRTKNSEGLDILETLMVDYNIMGDRDLAAEGGLDRQDQTESRSMSNTL